MVINTVILEGPVVCTLMPFVTLSLLFTNGCITCTGAADPGVALWKTINTTLFSVTFHNDSVIIALWDAALSLSCVKLIHHERACWTCTWKNTRRRNWQDLHFQNGIHTYCSVAMQTWGAAGITFEVPPMHIHSCVFAFMCVCVCVQVYVCACFSARNLLQGLVRTPSVSVSEPLHGHWTWTLCSHQVRSSRHTAVRPDWSMSSTFQGVKVLSEKRSLRVYVVSSSY